MRQLVFLLIVIGLGIGIYFYKGLSRPTVVTIPDDIDIAETMNFKDTIADSPEIPDKDNYKYESAFKTIEPIEYQRLEPWLNDVFIPSLEIPEAFIRVNILNVDSAEFNSLLFDSAQIRSGSLWRTAATEEDDSDVIISLFDDVEFRIAVAQHKVGRNSGLITTRSRIVDKDATGREHVYFEISQDGSLAGSIAAGGRLFNIYPSIVPGQVVVAELDSKEYGSRIRID